MTNNRGYVSLLLLFLWSGLLQAASVSFAPVVRNFSVSDYHARIQNWAVAQDADGVMYIGNSKGMLEYDGNTWTLHELPTKEIVRSIYVADDGKIYVGSYEEFGYFERTFPEGLTYHSLKSELGEFKFHNDEIWSILPVGNKIIFQSFCSFFFYDGNRVWGEYRGELPLNLFQVHDTLYTWLIDKGLFIYSNGLLKPLFSNQDIKSPVVGGLPYREGVLFFTVNAGVFYYHDGKLEPWQTACDADLRRYSINRVSMSQDSCYIVGTLSNGLYAINKSGGLQWKLNTDGGLLNNTVLGICCDSSNNVWAALDNGIAYVQNTLPISYYTPPYDKIGMVYDVLVHKDAMYIASNQGLYYWKDGKISLVPGLEEQAWFVDEYNGQVLCGHNKGTFLISQGKARLLSSATGALCMREITLNGHPYLLQGSYSPLCLFKQDHNGRWVFSHIVKGFSHMASNIETDHRGNIWVEHMRKGLFRLRISPDLKELQEVRPYMKLGNVEDAHFTLFKVNGRVVFSNGEAFYTYEDVNDSIVPYDSMNEQLAELTDIQSVKHGSGNDYWFLNDRMAYLVECEMNQFHIRYRIPYALFEDQLLEERATISYDASQETAYLCLNNAVARIISKELPTHTPVPPQAVLSILRMEAKDEESGEERLLAVGADNRIDGHLNTWTFTLRYPAYNNYAYKVRYRLQGFSEQWTEAGRQLSQSYARLPYGDYTFQAEVYDENGTLASVECPFVLLPPWYLSGWAIAGYILLGIALLFCLQYTFYWAMKRKKDHAMEHQRILHQAELEKHEKKIVELEKERLETDLRTKSKELAGMVMTNIVHQEFLNQLKEEIQKQRLAPQFTRKSLDKLLSLVNNNIVSDEENWQVFQANFDRIHENFFRNLKQQYPSLTSGDLRVCALLRLNLPTKEIAKLLNLSIRGVDAARYRLRKKFNLAPEDSLTAFMISFK